MAKQDFWATAGRYKIGSAWALAAAGCAIVLIAGLVWMLFSKPALGVPTPAAWDRLKHYAVTIAFVDGMGCHLDPALGAIKTAEAESEFSSLEARYTLSAEEKAQLAQILNDASGLGTNLSGGATAENCLEAMQLIDNTIAQMKAT
jgi:hypothetical protein